MNGLLQDLRYAVRQLGKNPGFITVAVSIWGLGIGANTAIFSIFNATLLRPLPYKVPDPLSSNLTDSGIPERRMDSATTASLFPLLGTTPELGSAFSSEEQLPGYENAVLLNHRHCDTTGTAMGKKFSRAFSHHRSE